MKTFLVDPKNITNFNCDEKELQLVLLFWIAAAGKKASVVAKNLEKLMKYGERLFKTDEPFTIIKQLGDDLPETLKSHGFGCFNNKAKSMLALAWSNLDLKKCSVMDLEAIWGVGPKTARCFLMHSRKNSRFAGLDTHVLKYMRQQGIDVPKSTPSGKKYLEIEQKFLELADKSGKSLAEFDLEIWNHYSGKNKEGYFVG
jgi:thermostable 8-oxoguanine DNA glycosylase